MFIPNYNVERDKWKWYWPFKPQGPHSHIHTYTPTLTRINPHKESQLETNYSNLLKPWAAFSFKTSRPHDLSPILCIMCIDIVIVLFIQLCLWKAVSHTVQLLTIFKILSSYVQNYAGTIMLYQRSFSLQNWRLLHTHTHTQSTGSGCTTQISIDCETPRSSTCRCSISPTFMAHGRLKNWVRKFIRTLFHINHDPLS